MEQTIRNIPVGTGDEIEEDTDQRGEDTSSVSHESSGRSPRRKKRHSKVKSRQSSVSGVLEGLEEDVLEVDETVITKANETNHEAVEHNISERLFVQNKKGFEPASKDKVFRSSFYDLSQSQEVDTEKDDLMPQEFAIYLYHKTRLFFSFCHGILGGFGVAHMSLVLSIADNPSAVRSFAEGYPDFARVVQILYYTLSAICFISVLDRCDFAGLRFAHCIEFVKYRTADILTIIFYLGVLVATVVCIPWDDRIALSSYNEDLWKNYDESHSEFVQWKIMSIVRGTLAVLGYVTMFFGPGDDLFYIHLYNMVKREENGRKDGRSRY